MCFEGIIIGFELIHARESIGCVVCTRNKLSYFHT